MTVVFTVVLILDTEVLTVLSTDVLTVLFTEVLIGVLTEVLTEVLSDVLTEVVPLSLYLHFAFWNYGFFELHKAENKTDLIAFKRLDSLIYGNKESGLQMSKSHLYNFIIRDGTVDPISRFGATVWLLDDRTNLTLISFCMVLRWLLYKLT